MRVFAQLVPTKPHHKDSKYVDLIDRSMSFYRISKIAISVIPTRAYPLIK